MIAETSMERVYNPDLVKAHPIDSKFKKTFAEILRKDYDNDTYGFSRDILGILCIEHDAWEKSLSGDDDKTMDCSTSVAVYDNTNNHYSNHRHLMIELKLRCKSHTLGKDVYLGKIGHSRDLLKGHPVHPASIFVFIESVQRKAKSEIAHWRRGSDGSAFKSVIAMTPQNLNDFIGFENQYPYQPINKGEDIRNGLIGVQGDAEKILQMLAHWKQQAIIHLNAYRHIEYVHICATVSSLADLLLDSISDNIDRELIRLELDDFKKDVA